LLDRQLAAQAAAFEENGGFTERLYRTRSTQGTDAARWLSVNYNKRAVALDLGNGVHVGLSISQAAPMAMPVMMSAPVVSARAGDGSAGGGTLTAVAAAFFLVNQLRPVAPAAGVLLKAGGQALGIESQGGELAP
jgi:hypothetical protein